MPTRTNEHSDYTKLNFHSLKQAADRLEMGEDSSMEQKHGRSIVLGKDMLFLYTSRGPERGFAGEEGEGHSM